MRTSCAGLVIIGFVVSEAGAQEERRSAAIAASGGSITVAVAVPAPVPPAIDGRGGDDVWRDAPVLDEFTEYYPHRDATPKVRTEMRFAFDARHLYILARMHDHAPDSIMARLGRRDVDYPADWIGVTIDGFRDRRSGQEFRVSAGGGLYDALRTRDGQTGLNTAWDGVWDAAVTRDSAGWTAEFRIPFSQLRFSSTDRPVFGLLVRRNVGRDDSEHAWPRVDAARAYTSWIAQGGDLTGFAGIERSSGLELSPYVVATNETRASRLPGEWDHPTTQKVGADLRYGLTSNISLNATLNPDFGQVEADPSELNLSAYELFYPERRSFFTEGSSVFDVRVWCDGVLAQECTSPVYSRRIGRAPQLASRYGDASSPLFAGIAGAAKVTGRLDRGISFGLLGAVTQREAGVDDRTIEPATSFLVARLQQDFGSGRGEIGTLLTSTWRDVDEWSAPYLRTEAHVAGFDFRRRLGVSDLEVQGSLLGSLARGSAAAITAMQRDGVHRYQRIGGGLSVDTTRTSLTGHASRLTVGKVGGRVLWEVGYQSLSPGFDMNDLGYQRRADMQRVHAWTELTTRNGRGWYRERFAGAFLSLGWNTRGQAISRGEFPWPSVFNLYAMHRLQNTGQLNVIARVVSPNRPVDDFVTRGGPAVRLDPAYQLFWYYATDNRKRLRGEWSVSLWNGDQGRAGTEWTRLALTARPTDRLQASLAIVAFRWRGDQQWFANRGVSGSDTTHYTFARFRRVDVDPRLRLDWTISPTLTFQWYSQPYWASVDYENWRETADPTSQDYDARFKPYGSGDPGAYSLNQLRTNAVLRWEFRPGSIMYAVWQQRRDAFQNEWVPMVVSRQLDRLLGAHPNNTFVLKASYWINP